MEKVKVAKLKDGVVVNVYNGMREASRQNNIGHQGIYNCCNGLSNTAGGFQWEYFEGKDYSKL